MTLPSNLYGTFFHIIGSMSSQRQASWTTPKRAIARRLRFGPASAFVLFASMPLVFMMAGIVPAPLATLLVIAPIAEEIIFRAGLQETLLRHLSRRSAAGALVANILTALAFSAAHVALHANAIAALTVLPSLLVGRVYQQQRRLIPCIALHALFNAIWLLWAGIPT
jgi:membrane protease YdiL (CAAX protease family)